MPRQDTTRRLPDLLAQLDEPFTGEALFDCCADLVFFIKNLRGEYVAVNREMVERCGLRAKSDILGRRADEVHPPPLGASYRAQDERLLRTGEPILNQLELQLYHSGRPGWCLTHKLPLRGRQGQVVGLVGVSQDLHAPRDRGADYAQVAAAIDRIQTHFDEPLRIPELAARAGLSPYQFDRRIRRIFQLTAGQFIHKVRLEAALRRLRESADPIGQIALDCGYADQSAFSRQFRQTVGLTPGQFRLVEASARKHGK